MDIAGIDLIGMIKPQLEHLADALSKIMAETIEQSWVQKLVGGFLETQRQVLRAQVKARDEAQREAEKTRDAEFNARQKAIQDMIKSGEEEFERTASFTDRIAKANQHIAELKKTIAGEDIRSAKAAQDVAEMTRTQIHLNDLLRQQEEARRRAQELQFRQNEDRQKGLRADLGSGKFDDQMRRIIDLEKDAALSIWGGNRARAQTDINMAKSLRESIRSQLIADERSAATKSPTEKLMDQLLQSIAPIKEGNTWRVTLVDSPD
jgi:hypothetical protein